MVTVLPPENRPVTVSAVKKTLACNLQRYTSNSLAEERNVAYYSPRFADLRTRSHGVRSRGCV